MSYEPTVWQTGDVVTSQKLNKLEQGVADAGGGGGALIVDTELLHEDSIKCLITAGEMLAAAKVGPVIIKFSFGGEDYYFNVIQFTYEASAPMWNFVTLNLELDGGFLQFNATEESGYPIAPIA